VVLTDSLSKTNNAAAIRGTLKGLETQEWISQILTKAFFGAGRSAFDYSFEIRATVNGYGYGMATATILSCIALLVYSTIAYIHVIYSTCFNWTT
jgi:hypothetical protein